MGPSFGIISYNSINIGDEIQSIAARRFLPKIDYYINREQLSLFRPKDQKTKVKLIMNAWYMWRTNYFPPEESIDPLLISMCWSKRVQNSKDFTPKIKDYFIKNGPVGCRDEATLSFLRSQQVPAFFSGCLTTTLQGNRKNEGDGYVLCVNAPKEIFEDTKRKSRYPVFPLSKQIGPYISSIDRFKIAKAYLFLLQNANLVITSNLHSALPAIAFGTPVCLILPDPENDKGDLLGRIQGFENVVNFCSKNDFLYKNNYDVSNPPSNPNGYKEMRDALIQKCSSFTGFDSNKPLFEPNYNPLIEVLQCLEESDKNIKRTLYFSSCRDLLSVIVDKKIKKKTQFDLRW